jgi:hypothetical protein
MIVLAVGGALEIRRCRVGTCREDIFLLFEATNWDKKKKLREGVCLGLKLPPFSRKTQQSTKSQCRWWGLRWREDATGVERVGGHCCIVPGGKWNDEKS